MENPDTYDITFRNAKTFDSFMSRGSITALFKDGRGPAIYDFSDLEAGKTYSTAICSIPARAESLEQS